VPPERLHGIDLQPDRVAKAAATLPGATVVEGDLLDLPYPDEHFAAVFVILTLSSLGAGASAIVLALREARRVLAPGGVLICYEPRVPNPLNRATTAVSRSLIERGVGAWVDHTTLTAMPTLSRRLGRSAPRLYPLLAGIPPLRTHALHRFVEPSAGDRYEGSGAA
jgi:ubiquinone/menaquinone biosynthesis C-methylase UbiE